MTSTILLVLVATGIFAALLKSQKKVSELQSLIDEMNGLKENTWDDNFQQTQMHQKDAVIEAVPSSDEHFHFNSGSIEVSYRKINDD